MDILRTFSPLFIWNAMPDGIFLWISFWVKATEEFDDVQLELSAVDFRGAEKWVKCDKMDIFSMEF